ncbi:Fc receptor-like protein 5, partial [Clarias magur]
LCEDVCGFNNDPHSVLISLIPVTPAQVLISLIPVIQAQEKPPAVLSVSPQRWLTEGDSVTLSCEVTDSSTDWTFSWHMLVPVKHNDTYKKDKKVLFSNNSRGSKGTYILSPAALNHTGVYTCRGKGGQQSIDSNYSKPQPLWITGESPPVSLIINPNRTQHFTGDSLTLSCEDQSHSTGWTVRRYTQNGSVSDCSQWGSVTGSTCNISSLNITYTGVYWCESESGENSNPVNITVQKGDVILESPVHPVTEGRPLTLRCLYRNTKPSNHGADFYKDGSFLQNQTTGEMIIHNVSKSDEGFYHCNYTGRKRGESPKSWVSVRVSTSKSSGGTERVAVGLSLAICFIVLIILMLWCCKINKEKQQKTNQTSEQNQRRSGAEDSESGHTPLQPVGANIYGTVDQEGEAAAESREVTYAQVTNRKENVEPSDGDVTYADLEIKPKNKSVGETEKSSVDSNPVYSEVKLNPV